MAGGKNKIHEHPNAGINSFKERPEDAGYPKGKQHKATILRKVLEAKYPDKEKAELDPYYWFASEMIDIVTKKGVRDNDKSNALEKLMHRFFGMPKIEIETNPTKPAILPPDEATRKELEKL